MEDFQRRLRSFHKFNALSVYFSNLDPYILFLLVRFCGELAFFSHFDKSGHCPPISGYIKISFNVSFFTNQAIANLSEKIEQNHRKP